VDWVVVTAVWMVANTLLSPIYETMGKPAVLALLVALLLDLVYRQLCFGRVRGDTLGNRLYRVQTLRADGAALTRSRNFARDMARLALGGVGGLAPWLMLFPLALLFFDAAFVLGDGQRRTLHDRWASTVVVRGFSQPQGA